MRLGLETTMSAMPTPNNAAATTRVWRNSSPVSACAAGGAKDAGGAGAGGGAGAAGGGGGAVATLNGSQALSAPA
jgi:hypothetical protein